MKLSETVSKVKAFIWACQDRYDAFMESPVETHVACAGLGVVIGIYLASLVWR